MTGPTMACHPRAPDCPCSCWSALADPTRWVAVTLLAERELTVSELLDRLDVEQNVLSYHLSVLRDVGLVRSRRDGRWVRYRLAMDGFEHLHDRLPGGDRHQPHDQDRSGRGP